MSLHVEYHQQTDPTLHKTRTVLQKSSTWILTTQLYDGVQAGKAMKM
jgi:hypothetical protein